MKTILLKTYLQEMINDHVPLTEKKGTILVLNCHVCPSLQFQDVPEDIKEFGLRFKNCDVHSRCRHFIASAHSQHVLSNKPHVFIVFIRGEAKKDSLCRFRYDPYKQNRKQLTICFSLTKQMIFLPCNPGGITPILGLNFLRHLRDFLRHLRHLRCLRQLHVFPLAEVDWAVVHSHGLTSRHMGLSLYEW